MMELTSKGYWVITLSLLLTLILIVIYSTSVQHFLLSILQGIVTAIFLAILIILSNIIN